MDQQELRDMEYLCIQEESPWCQAACPLHVDVRTLARCVAGEDWECGWKALRKGMPFPSILGRICDGPCMAQCKRSQAGGAIRIPDLERACTGHPGPRIRVLPLPARDRRVGVLGSGLAGLTVAWDLSRKGYPVTLFEPGQELAQDLRSVHAGDLDPVAVREELEVLGRLGVMVRLEADLNRAGFLNDCLEEFDALFLSLDMLGTGSWTDGPAMDQDASGEPQLDSGTMATSHERIFGGGDHPSPVWRAAQGRFAATSMDRLLQNVSLTANRDKEGPCATRLFTSLEGVEPRPEIPMSHPSSGYSDEEAREEAGRCLQCECMECVKACAYLERYKGHPKKYARQIYNNESIVKGHRQANRFINSCMLCGQCEVICPNDFSMAGLCLETRRSMVRRGNMPPSAHDFALEELRFARSEAFSLLRHAPGTDSSTWLFFPGCQLAGSSPDHVAAGYAWLRNTMDGGVGLMLGCCGAPALWSGRDELFGEVLDELRSATDSMGGPTIITACATCALMLSEHAPDLDAISLWEIMADHELPGSMGGGTYALHDPCTARHNTAMQDGVRRMLARLDVTVEELPLGRETTSCCGYGGLLYNADPGLAREVAEKRAAESDHPFVAYCAMCRDNLARGGANTIHLLDLVFPDGGRPDSAARPDPGFSRRHDNRARLRQRLLAGLWKEEAGTMPVHGAIRLEHAPGIRELCEDRRILDEDLQKVIHHAESTGRKLCDPDTGRFLAGYQPVRVTFWVEYEALGEEEDRRYLVHNAYSHRMVLPGGGS